MEQGLAKMRNQQRGEQKVQKKLDQETFDAEDYTEFVNNHFVNLKDSRHPHSKLDHSSRYKSVDQRHKGKHIFTQLSVF
jgi:hypothetical protein